MGEVCRVTSCRPCESGWNERKKSKKQILLSLPKVQALFLCRKSEIECVIHVFLWFNQKKRKRNREIPESPA